MNNKGKASGLALIIILIVAVIIAWLFMRQMGNSRSAEQDKKRREEVETLNGFMIRRLDHIPEEEDPLCRARYMKEAVLPAMRELRAGETRAVPAVYEQLRYHLDSIAGMEKVSWGTVF